MHANRSKAALTSAILWTFSHSVAARDCFYPDGTICTHYTYVACGPETGPESACCGRGHGCSVNGYCMGNTGSLYRGACTGDGLRVRKALPERWSSRLSHVSFAII